MVTKFQVGDVVTLISSKVRAWQDLFINHRELVVESVGPSRGYHKCAQYWFVREGQTAHEVNLKLVRRCEGPW